MNNKVLTVKFSGSVTEAITLATALLALFCGPKPPDLSALRAAVGDLTDSTKELKAADEAAGSSLVTSQE